MSTSFAQIRTRLLLSMTSTLVMSLASCASVPPPTAELGTAQQAVARANAADADQYAAPNVADARRTLEQAQLAASKGRDDDARALALQAAATADLATAYSREAAANGELARRRAENADLKRRLQVETAP